MERFEVGKCYEAADMGIDPIKVIKRTAKSILVDNGLNKWYMRIRTDEKGEYVTDSSAPAKWRGICTYRTMWVIEEG